MKRRSFLKSIVGFLALPYLPQVKPKPKIEACFKPVSSYIGNAPTEFGQQIGWKVTYTSRILKDDFICVLKATA